MTLPSLTERLICRVMQMNRDPPGCKYFKVEWQAVIVSWRLIVRSSARLSKKCEGWGVEVFYGESGDRRSDGELDRRL